MNRLFALIAGSLLLTAAPAMAQDAAAPAAAAPAAACTRPAPPAAIDGAASSLDQMQVFRGLVTAFIADSDTYQACLVAEVKAKRDYAKVNRTKFDDRVASGAEKSIDANQKDKIAVGQAFTAARKAYTAAHPA